jgi:hypothetical protein
MKKWFPVPAHLLEPLKYGTCRSKFEASAIVTGDRKLGVKKSAREYAKEWGWSKDKVVRFMSDPENFTNLQQPTNDPPETSTVAGLQVSMSHKPVKNLAKLSEPETSPTQSRIEPPKTSAVAGLQVGVSHKQGSNHPETSLLLIKRKEIKDTSVLFEKFYSAYPRHQNRSAAEAAFLKLNPSVELFDQMMSAISWQTKQPEWQKNSGQFIPLPSTWINRRRWEDEEPPATPITPSATSDIGATADYLREMGLIQ